MEQAWNVQSVLQKKGTEPVEIYQKVQAKCICKSDMLKVHEHARNVQGAHKEHSRKQRTRGMQGSCKEAARNMRTKYNERDRNMHGTCEEHSRNLHVTCNINARIMHKSCEYYARNIQIRIQSRIARQTSKEVTSSMQRPLRVAPTRTLTANVCEMTHVSSPEQNRH